MAPSQSHKLLALLVVITLLTVPIAAQIPDPKELSGVPLPVGDVPRGTVTVRVIRGALSNNVSGQLVELFVDGTRREQKTADSGRAEFSGLRPGSRVRALAVVGSERLESQEFAVPAAGGIRLLLVATDPGALKGDDGGGIVADPAQAGTIVLGDQSRFVFEMGDGALNVYNILQITNTAGTAVEPREPIAFEAAPNGGTVTMLGGSSPRASAEGRRVVVAGPFPPGATLVQFGYSVRYSGPAVTIEQRMPLPLNRTTVAVQKVGEMQVSSPQIAQHREMSAQGETYVVGQGPGVKAGETVSFSFSGLPFAPLWPRNVALALAAMILAAGAWASVRSRPAAAGRGEQDDLESRRDRLFSELTALERRHRAGGSAAAEDASRRRELVTELESVYAALDSDASRALSN
jgi:hypothetical protein